MATYTSNYAWTKPGGNDQVDISVLNGNLDSQDAIMHKAFTNMAPPFSGLSTYAVGDVVLYDNVTYKCHTAVTVAGAWTGSTNWQVYKLSEGGGGSSLTAGDYIDITAGVISVKKEKGEYSLERYVLQSTGGGAPKLVVKKYIDSELISTNEYANNTAHVNIDDTLEIWYSYNPYNWHYKLLVDGVDHSAGYEYEFSYTDTTEYPVDFHIAAGDSTDLVTKSDLTADNVMMSDGVTSVEDAIDEVSSGLDNVITKSLSVSNRSFTDFDTAVDGGLYISSNYKTFNGSPQSTSDDSCILLVLNDSPYAVQICISTYRFDNIYIRRNIGSGWLAWKRISLT